MAKLWNDSYVTWLPPARHMTNQEVPWQQTHLDPDSPLLKSVPVTYHVLNKPEVMYLRVDTCMCVSGVLLCLFSGVLSGFSSATDQQHTVSLSGKWSLSNSNGSLSLPAEVPGCVHSALQQQGYIQVSNERISTLESLYFSLLCKCSRHVFTLNKYSKSNNAIKWNKGSIVLFFASLQYTKVIIKI